MAWIGCDCPDKFPCDSVSIETWIEIESDCFEMMVNLRGSELMKVNDANHLWVYLEGGGQRVSQEEEEGEERGERCAASVIYTIHSANLAMACWWRQSGAPPPSLSLSLSLFHSVLPPSHANPLKYNEIIISDRRRPRDQSAIQETDETEANFLKPPSEDKEKQRRRNRDRTQEMQRTGYHYYCYYYCCYPHYPCGVSYYYSIHFFFCCWNIPQHSCSV